MNFKQHSELAGQHAILSPSKYHWLGYDDDKLSSAYSKFMAIQRGTRLHEFAKECIELGIKLPKTKISLNQYVNDAIGYRMVPEQVLFYSLNAFGTVDAICFRDDLLRIHDLKTGESTVSMNQLSIYSSLFCLEYAVKPQNISIELRIYQKDNILVHIPESEEIFMIMNKIVDFDKKIDKLKMEEEL